MPIGYRAERTPYCAARSMPSSVAVDRTVEHKSATLQMTIVHLLAFLFSLVALWFLFQVESVCVRCGGRGAHRESCPLKK
jgi:hypothetical protein